MDKQLKLTAAETQLSGLPLQSAALIFSHLIIQGLTCF